MGRLQEHFSSNDASPFLGPPPPLSGAGDSSPSPLLLPAPPGGKRSSRRHVIVRLICSPFSAVFRTTCSPRARPNDEDQGNKAARRRPRLEELLKMESASSAPEELIKKPSELVVPDVDDDSSWTKESAIVVFGAFGEEEEDGAAALAAVSEEEEDDQLEEYAVPPGRRQMAIVRPAGLGGVSQTAALMNVKRLVVLLEAMRARSSMALKVKGSSSSSSYWRLAGPGGPAADKAGQLFYDRPIPLGRRCRVQHLQESSPYQ